MKKSAHELVSPSERLLTWIHVHRTNSDSSVAPHWHRSIELSFTLTGSIDSFTIGDKDYQTQAGQILVVNSQEVHSVEVKKKSVPNECALTLTYPYHFVLSQFPDMDDYVIAINESQYFSALQEQKYKLLQGKLRKIILLYEGQDLLRNLKLNLLLLEVLVILLDYFRVERHQVQKIDSNLEVAERLHLVTQYVQEHYQEEFGLDEIASLIHLSKSYTARFIKQNLGRTLGEYVGAVRAQHAKKALLETKENFSKIALDHGFSGLRTMNRALEKHYQKNARQLREER